MSFVKLALQLAFWYAMAFFVPKLLAPFVGIQTANYIYWGFIVVYISGAYILGKIASKQGHRNSKILPVTGDIPKSLYKIVTELEELSFTQIGVIKYKPMFGLLGTQVVYTYLNPSRNIFAYAKTNEGAHVIFSCYFPDGFDVSTNFPIGLPVDSDKLIRRIVKSSIQAALDFHKHHAKKRIATHGKPKQFTNIQEMLDWEDQHQLAVEEHKSANKVGKKIWLRLIAAMIIAPILGGLLLVPVVIYFLVQGYEQLPAFFNTLIGVVSFGSLIVGLLWAYRPLYKPETVEERKKKEFA